MHMDEMGLGLRRKIHHEYGKIEVVSKENNSRCTAREKEGNKIKESENGRKERGSRGGARWAVEKTGSGGAVAPWRRGGAATPLRKKFQHVDRALKVWFFGKWDIICSRKMKRKGTVAPFWSKEGGLKSLACWEKMRIGIPF